MNKHQKTEEADGLRKVLSDWTVDAALPPRFQEQVWQRIAQAQARPRPGASWLDLWRLIELMVPRPQFALAYLAVLLVAGVAAGSLAAQARTSRLDSELSTRYVQSIDPYHASSSPP